MALEAFQQSNFAGDETAGNIYASMMEGIKIYQQRDIARLTSMNSLDSWYGLSAAIKNRVP